VPRARGERSVCQGGGDDLENAIGVRRDFVVGEPQDCVALGAKKGVAARVVTQTIIGEVRLAIHLDNQFRMMAGEVGDIGADGGLLAEVVATGAEGVQQPPRAAF